MRFKGRKEEQALDLVLDVPLKDGNRLVDLLSILLQTFKMVVHCFYVYI